MDYVDNILPDKRYHHRCREIVGRFRWFILLWEQRVDSLFITCEKASLVVVTKRSKYVL